MVLEPPQQQLHRSTVPTMTTASHTALQPSTALTPTPPTTSRVSASTSQSRQAASLLRGLLYPYVVPSQFTLLWLLFLDSGECLPAILPCCASGPGEWR